MSHLEELLDRRHFSESVDAVLYARPHFTTLFFPLFALSFLAIAVWLAFVPFSPAVHARGDLRVAGDTLRLQSEEEGRVTAVGVAEGAFVERGAMLFELDGATARIDLARLDAEIERTEESIVLLRAQRERVRRRGAMEVERIARDVERQQAMFERGIVAKQVVETLESDRRAVREASRQEELALEAEVVAARQALARLGSERDRKRIGYGQRTIRAPQAGVISRLHVTAPGLMVSRGTVLAELTPRGRPMEFEAIVAPHDIGRIRADQAVLVKLDAYPYRQFGTIAGRVAFVAPDRGENGYRIRVAMAQPPPGMALRTGMTGSIDVLSPRRPLYRFVAERLGFLAAAP